MLDKARLGTRYTCFQCQTKFYDLNRPTPTCPECDTDQSDAPVQDIKSLLSKGGGRKRKLPPPDEEPVKAKTDDDDEEGEEDDEIGLLGDSDDDDDDDDLE